MQEVKIYAVLFRSVSFLFYCHVCIWPREAGNAVEDCEDHSIGNCSNIFVRMYIQNRRIHSEAVATVTEVTNDDMMGGYSQKLTLEYTYDGKKYVIEDLQTINLQAEKEICTRCISATAP